MSCAECGKEARWRCALCAEQYCSRKCQKRAWPLHGAVAHEASAAARLESRGATRDSARMILQSDLGVLTAPGVGADTQGRMGIALVPRAEIGAKRQRDVTLPFRWHRDAESGEADTTSVITGDSLEKEAQAVRPEDFLPIAESWARMVTRVDAAQQSEAYRGQLENFAYRLYAWHNETIAAYAYQVGADPNARWTLVPTSDQADDLYTALSWLLMPGRTWMTAMPQRAVTVASDIFLSMINDGLSTVALLDEVAVLYKGPTMLRPLPGGGNNGNDWLSLLFDRRGSYFHSLANDNRITTWYMESGKVNRTLKLPDRPVAMVTTDDGLVVAIGNSIGRIQDSEPKMYLVAEYNSRISQLIVADWTESVHKYSLITAHENGAIVNRTYLGVHTLLYTVPAAEGVPSNMVIGGPSTTAAGTSSVYLYISTTHGAIIKIQFSYDSIGVPIPPRENEISFYRNGRAAQYNSRDTLLAIAPSGKVLYSGDTTGEVTFWNTATVGEKLKVIIVGDNLGSLQTNPHGSRLFVGTTYDVFIFDTATGQRISTVSARHLPAGREYFSRIAISPNGKRMHIGVIITNDEEEEEVDDTGFIRVYDIVE